MTTMPLDTLTARVEMLTGALGRWWYRDTTGDPAAARAAGETALAVIDAIGAELRDVRARLVSEISRWDDARERDEPG